MKYYITALICFMITVSTVFSTCMIYKDPSKPVAEDSPTGTYTNAIKGSVTLDGNTADVVVNFVNYIADDSGRAVDTYIKPMHGSASYVYDDGVLTIKLANGTTYMYYDTATDTISSDGFTYSKS